MSNTTTSPRPQNVDLSFTSADASHARANNLCHGLGIGRTTLWRWCRDGHFPKPIKLSDRVTVWRMADVREWLAAKGSAA